MISRDFRPSLLAKADGVIKSFGNGCGAPVYHHERLNDFTIPSLICFHLEVFSNQVIPETLSFRSLLIQCQIARLARPRQQSRNAQINTRPLHLFWTSDRLGGWAEDKTLHLQGSSCTPTEK
jgi:hypothetical protein